MYKDFSFFIVNINLFIYTRIYFFFFFSRKLQRSSIKHTILIDYTNTINYTRIVFNFIIYFVSKEHWWIVIDVKLCYTLNGIVSMIETEILLGYPLQQDKRIYYLVFITGKDYSGSDKSVHKCFADQLLILLFRANYTLERNVGKRSELNTIRY